jgi:CheY-like chemotaxis protein
VTTSALDCAQKRSVLLVDDSDELRESYELALAAEGYEVRSAPLAEKALEILRTWRPDLIVTDLFMPGMGGLDFLTRLRSDLKPPIPPVVVVSGFPDAEAEALRRGAAHFETKPLSLDELLRAVRNAIEARPPQPREPAVLKQRRDATRAIGEATLARFLTENPRWLDARRDQVLAAARFFGHPILFFLLRGGRFELVVSSASTAAFQLGADASEVLPIMSDVVESDSSLVLTNVASSGLLKAGSPAIRFLVAVPYVLNRAVVGALCLVDEMPSRFGSAELGILEYLVGRATATMGGSGAPRAVEDSGLLDRAAFSAMFAGSVKAAQAAGHALGFALFETAEVPRDGSLAGLLVNLPAPQLMVGVLDRNHLAAFVVAESLAQVRERLVVTRREIQSRLAVNAIAELSYEDPVPVMDPESFMARGQDVLTRAIAECVPGSVPFLAIDTRRRPAA